MISDERTTALRELQQIPSIGKACSLDLWRLGVKKISDLKNRNPRDLYDQLNTLTGVIQDPCMLYTFRCAVYFASTKNPQKAKLKWWYWKDKVLRSERV
jgi:hypothetical protein